MKIKELKAFVKTGDALLTVSSKWVRFFTMESFSHTAIILKEELVVYVVETHESTGTTSRLLFDDWIQKYDLVFLGIPDKIIVLNRITIKQTILDYLEKPESEKRYGYWTLPLVWWNQIVNRKSKHKLNVCSTFVQEIWNSVGWKLGKLADPGDIAMSCLELHRIEK